MSSNRNALAFTPSAASRIRNLLNRVRNLYDSVGSSIASATQLSQTEPHEDLVKGAQQMGYYTSAGLA